MRGRGSITIIILVGCGSGQKPPARVDNPAVRQAPSALDASPPTEWTPGTSQRQATSPELPIPDPAPSGSNTPETPAPAAPKATPAPEQRPSAAEARACAARGGTVQPICLSGELACIVRYRDGGKRCTDKRDCTGECLYEGPDPAPPKATGACQRTSDPCGCKAPIHHGHAEPALCAD